MTDRTFPIFDLPPAIYGSGHVGMTREFYNQLLSEIENLSRAHPDWNTPNWCNKCTPKGIGYCRCEIACNE